MFRIRIFKLKDIVKIVIILLFIYVLFVFIMNKINIKLEFNNSFKINTTNYLTFAIDRESDVIKSTLSKSENQELFGKISSDIIYKKTSNIFNTDEYINNNIGQDNEEIIEKVDLAENKDVENNNIINTNILENVKTEVVTENPILESYNFEYNGVKIRNETSIELTESILNYDNLQINTENILVFHTHTCESYTQTENYRYNPSRKL